MNFITNSLSHSVDFNDNYPVILINRSISDWTAAFPDPIMANALMDRLCHNAHQIVIKCESYRKKFKPEIKNG